MSVFSHRVVSPTGHISDHHVGHRHNLAILGFLNEDGNTARDDLTVKLDALGTSYELSITVVTCSLDRNKYRYMEIKQNNLTSITLLRLIPTLVLFSLKVWFNDQYLHFTLLTQKKYYKKIKINFKSTQCSLVAKPETNLCNKDTVSKWPHITYAHTCI